MTDPTTVVAPVWIIIALLAPLYGLIGGLYLLLFKHSTNEDRHFDKKVCQDTKDQIRGYIKDVDTRAAESIKEFRKDITRQFDRLAKLIEKVVDRK